MKKGGCCLMFGVRLLLLGLAMTAGRSASIYFQDLQEVRAMIWQTLEIPGVSQILYGPGHVWFGSGRELTHCDVDFLLDPYRYAFECDPGLFLREPLMDLDEADNGGVYIGDAAVILALTHSRLYRIEPGKVDLLVNFTEVPGLEELEPTSLAHTADGQIWIGSRQGLLLVQEKEAPFSLQWVPLMMETGEEVHEISDLMAFHDGTAARLAVLASEQALSLQNLEENTDLLIHRLFPANQPDFQSLAFVGTNDPEEPMVMGADCSLYELEYGLMRAAFTAPPNQTCSPGKAGYTVSIPYAAYYSQGSGEVRWRYLGDRSNLAAYSILELPAPGSIQALGFAAWETLAIATPERVHVYSERRDGAAQSLERNLSTARFWGAGSLLALAATFLPGLRKILARRKQPVLVAAQTTPADAPAAATRPDIQWALAQAAEDIQALAAPGPAPLTNDPLTNERPYHEQPSPEAAPSKKSLEGSKENRQAQIEALLARYHQAGSEERQAIAKELDALGEVSDF